jgi:peptide deformylase
LKINTYPKNRNVLLSKSKDIPLGDLKDWISFVDEMKQYADDHDTCVGLAANQVWEMDSAYPSIFIMGMNPTIMPTGKTIKQTGSCLSRPGKAFIIGRAENVARHYYNLAGESLTEKYGGVYAQVIQHEMQHLSGSILKKEWKGIR